MLLINFKLIRCIAVIIWQYYVYMHPCSMCTSFSPSCTLALKKCYLKMIIRLIFTFMINDYLKISSINQKTVAYLKQEFILLHVYHVPLLKKLYGPFGLAVNVATCKTNFWIFPFNIFFSPVQGFLYENNFISYDQLLFVLILTWVQKFLWFLHSWQVWWRITSNS